LAPRARLSQLRQEKMCDIDSFLYLVVSLTDALLAAALSSLAVWPMHITWHTYTGRLHPILKVNLVPTVTIVPSGRL